MSFSCSLSGKGLVDGVVSTKTGHVFERSTIEAHIDSTGQCPVTGCDLEKADLVDLKISKVIQPGNPEESSIPGTLKSLQDEWN
jgi:pre-mRNA-processing factor 19